MKISVSYFNFHPKTVPQYSNKPQISLFLSPLLSTLSFNSPPTKNPSSPFDLSFFKPKSPFPNYAVKAELEIRVCTNRTCRRQGSLRTLEILSGLAPPDISINSCGCLGRCGSGPNLVFLPDAIFVGHCGTAFRAAEVLLNFCGKDLSEASKNLEALALRKRGEEELEKSNLSEAEALLSEAIDLKPLGGLHIIYKSRSAARLAMGNYSGALEDAKEAFTIAPQYPQAYLSQGTGCKASRETRYYKYAFVVLI
ncbi:PREDICTED: uncharacterized protein LOC104611788 isoform X2 [Nelumbo nucifera]|uniref:Uncharacterized protein LOC104611788 isoform X2 n=1 Tax=Nelumbo nucifera TaxID=4432 RepID=A0A1U8BJM6_NELNU|nr:PREDICTED: uncharacterized protein LOC104611788 isoform X2 [Nelumbo nucifera]